MKQLTNSNKNNTNSNINIHELKEDVQKQINNNITTYEDIYNNYKKTTESKLLSYENTLMTVTAQLIEVKNKNYEDKIKKETIDDLVRFKKSADNSIYDINNKLLNLSRDFSNSNNSYIKLFMDNLDLPGLIGYKDCKYHSLRDFIEATIKDNDSFHNSISKVFNDLKFQKMSIENSNKLMLTQSKSIENNLIETLNLTMDRYKFDISGKISLFEKELNFVKIENGKYHLEAMKHVNFIN